MKVVPCNVSQLTGRLKGQEWQREDISTDQLSVRVDLSDRYWLWEQSSVDPSPRGGRREPRLLWAVAGLSDPERPEESRSL